MLAKSRGFSRQRTPWAACLAAAFAFLMGTPLSHALLEDSEKKALAEVFQTYKQSQTLGEFVKNNRGYLDPDSYAFLMKQTKEAASQKLPKMTVQNDARVSFKVDGTAYKLEFVSVRTQLLAINGREVEFLPNDSPETRYEKVMAVLQTNHASIRPIFLLLLEPWAAAAGGNVDPKRLRTIKTNFNSLASIVQTMLSVARERDTPCADRNKKIKELMSIYNRKPESYEPAQQQAMAEHPGVSMARGDLATEDDFTKQKYSCQSPDSQDLTERDIKALKEAGTAAKVDPKFYAADAATDPAELTPEQLNALSQKNVLNLTYKWKLQQIRDSLVELQKAEANNKTCYAEAVGLVREFLDKIKKTTKTGRLRCYIDQVAKDIKEQSKTAPVPIAPPATGAKGAGSASQ